MISKSKLDVPISVRNNHQNTDISDERDLRQYNALLEAEIKRKDSNIKKLEARVQYLEKKLVVDANSDFDTKIKRRDLEKLIENVVQNVNIQNLKRFTHPPILDKQTYTRRENIAIEFLQTEQSFVTGLEILVKAYHHSLQRIARSASSRLNEDQINRIFGNVEQILIINTQFCSEIEERLECWEEDNQDRLGDILVKWVPRLKPYTRYGSHYEENTEKIQEIKETNSSWRKAFEDLEKHIRSIGGLGLSDYFITPIQRIPRYKLLIKDLRRNTPRDHCDQRDLRKASIEMEKLATEMNEQIRRFQNQTQVWEIISRGGGFDRLLVHPKPQGVRTYVREGQVNTILDANDPKKGAKKKTELILFNDILVAANFVGKKVAYQDYYAPLGIMWLYAQVPKEIYQKLDLPEGEIQNPLYIKGPETDWVIGFKDEAEKESWMNVIADSVDTHKELFKEGRREGSYTFKFKGDYKGQWLNGYFHGFGKLQRPDKLEFEGVWNSFNKTGYGTVTNHLIVDKNGVSQTMECGWKEVNGIVKPVDNSGFWTIKTITDKDLTTIFTDCEIITLKPNDCLVEQGKKNTKIYRIKSGKMRFERVSEGKKKICGFLSGPSFFGDESIARKCETMNIVADTDVEVESISFDKLIPILNNDPGICKRFYRSLAQKLANRVIQPKKNDVGLTQVVDAVNTQEESGFMSGESFLNALRSKFHLDEDEYLHEQVDGVLKAVLRKFGRLYLFSTHLCFHAYIFGLDYSEVFSLRKITSIKLKRGVLVIEVKGRKIQFVEIENLEHFAQKLTNICASVCQEKRIESNSKTELTNADIITSKSKECNVNLIDMNQDDWNLLLSVAKVESFKPGHYILREGEENKNIYQIAHGKCLIKKRSGPDSEQILGTITTGALFGELTYLLQGKVSASVVAEGQVSICVVDGNYINTLFVDYPELAGRFYSYIVSVVAERLNTEKKRAKKKEKADVN